MAANASGNFDGWFERKRLERGRRALERQLDYQEAKAAAFSDSKDSLTHGNFLRSQVIRQRLGTVAPIADDARVLEVGSGARGLIFGFGSRAGVGIDPLAVDYKRLFPGIQRQATTVAGSGRNFPSRTARSISF